MTQIWAGIVKMMRRVVPVESPMNRIDLTLTPRLDRGPGGELSSSCLWMPSRKSTTFTSALSLILRYRWTAMGEDTGGKVGRGASEFLQS